jgi:hypothetical protein
VTAPVLLLTHSDDYYCIDLVQQALKARGVRALRVDTDRYPTEVRISARFAARERSFVLRVDDEEVPLDDVPAVWARRLWPGRLPPNLDARYAPHCRKESRTAFFDTLALVEGARWVNPVRPLFAAESKLLQLQSAQEVGFALPDTAITNDPDEARALYDRTGKRAVTKLLGALSQTMDASGDFVYTSALSDDDMGAVDQVQLCPQVFQAWVDKSCELRVIAVGEQLFTGAIDASASATGQVDWRLSRPGEAKWSRYELPDEVATRIHALMRKLDLRYGAVDLIVTPEDEHVFLEVNPAGEWGWLERDLGLPIGAALADELLAGAPS